LAYCKWSRGCNNPGPWLGRIKGAWHDLIRDSFADGDKQRIATEAESRGVKLYCVAHAREFDGLQIPLTIGPEGERFRNPMATPYFLFARRMLNTAVDDGIEAKEGEPTLDAMLARSWIEYRPDWKDGSDWYGSFEWCCHWLSLDVEKERSRALHVIDEALTRQYLAAKGSRFKLQMEEVVMQALGVERREVVRAAPRPEMQMALGF
jgi:hypothetical protein